MGEYTNCVEYIGSVILYSDSLAKEIDKLKMLVGEDL